MEKRLIVVMGVSGSGKTTVGRALQEDIGGHFIEADAFHSAANIEKMTSGTPLTDADREDWIGSIVAHVNRRKEQTLILACSALTPFVQAELKTAKNCEVTWLHLETDKDLLIERMAKRQHFMPAKLLDSQFAALSPPQDAICLNSARPISELVKACKIALVWNHRASKAL